MTTRGQNRGKTCSVGHYNRSICNLFLSLCVPKSSPHHNHKLEVAESVITPPAAPVLCNTNQEHLLCLCALQAIQKLLLTLQVAFATGSSTATPPLTPLSRIPKAALDPCVGWILSSVCVCVRAGYMASTQAIRCLEMMRMGGPLEVQSVLLEEARAYGMLMRTAFSTPHDSSLSPSRS